MGAFIKKNRQLLAYVFWGGGTTVVNFVTYYLFTQVIVLDIVVANMVAWAVSVLFAFFVNKVLVFHSGSWKLDMLVPEFLKFFGARLFSGILETVLLWICVDGLHLNDQWMKVLVSIVVMISNYVLSKLFIFSSKES